MSSSSAEGTGGGKSRLSRKDFLKLIGFGGVSVMIGLFAGGQGGGMLSSLLGNNHTYKQHQKSLFSPLIQQASAQQMGGTWTMGPNMTTPAIHAAVTFNGDILIVSGSQYCINNTQGPYQARLLNPTTGVASNLTLTKDLFCCGLNQLPNGNILMTGGTVPGGYDTDVNNCNGRWHGANYVYEFNVASGSLVEQTSMSHGRWYPTQVTLPDGRTVIVSGADEFGSYNFLTEVYDPNTRTTTIQYDPNSGNTYCAGSDAGPNCPGANTQCYGGPNQGTAPYLSLYPRMYLMPSGLVFQCGQIPNSFLWNPSTGVWTSVNNTSQYRDYGTAILLPLQNTTTERGRVMLVGGSTTDLVPATTVVEIQDFNQGTATSPVLRTGPSLNHGRKFILPVILPNGRIAVFGGSSQGGGNPVLIPEIFDPENEGQGWTDLTAATVPRLYHGVALLPA